MSKAESPFNQNLAAVSRLRAPVMFTWLRGLSGLEI